MKISDEIIKKFSGARIYDLEQPRYNGMPSFSGAKPSFVQLLHRRHADTYNLAQSGQRSSASSAIITSDHAGTHVDAICHQAEDNKLFGAIEVTSEIETPEGFTQLGAETIPIIIGQGYLLDVARYLGKKVLPNSYAITTQDLRGCKEEQGVDIAPGGIILVRTGSGQHWKDSVQYLNCAGLDPLANHWVLEQKPCMVGADNLSWDLTGIRETQTGASFYGHLLLLARNGIYIIENLYLEEMADDQIYNFLFIASPLKIQGATGSPIRPIAIRC
jgi:kynurenine formamidase